METTTPDAPPQGRFVSLRTLLITRFILMITLLTLALALIFYAFISPEIVAQVQGYVRESMREASVSEPQIDQIMSGSESRYFGEIRTGIRRNVLMGVAVFFVVGFASIYGITTQAMRWLRDLTEASRAIARGEYKQDLSHLYKGPTRSEISELARAIEDSGRVHIREQVLIQRVKDLEIKIDEGKKQQQVGEIVDSEFFQDLAHKAKTMRRKRAEPSDELPPLAE